jgi:hypothetical protein
MLYHTTRLSIESQLVEIEENALDNQPQSCEKATGGLIPRRSSNILAPTRWNAAWPVCEAEHSSECFLLVDDAFTPPVQRSSAVHPLFGQQKPVLCHNTDFLCQCRCIGRPGISTSVTPCDLTLRLNHFSSSHRTSVLHGPRRHPRQIRKTQGAKERRLFLHWDGRAWPEDPEGCGGERVGTTAFL